MSKEVLAHAGVVEDDEPERIERYMKLFEKEDVKKLQTGKWVWIEKDEWKLIPD